MERPDPEPFRLDPYRAGAAHVLGKTPDAVTSEERRRFKVALFNIVYTHPELPHLWTKPDEEASDGSI